MYLRNKKHRLISSVVVINNRQIIFKETKEAILKMKFIVDKEIKNYIANNKKTAINCVGSYKIEENYKYKFIDVIKGDLETIIGFPIKNFIDRLKK